MEIVLAQELLYAHMIKWKAKHSILQEYLEFLFTQFIYLFVLSSQNTSESNFQKCYLAVLGKIAFEYIIVPQSTCKLCK